jgi:hypothetical protein
LAQQSYTVTIDTTAMTGQSGAVVFDLAHPNSADNTLTISNFTNGTPVANEMFGTGDGATTVFSHTTAQTPVAPTSVAITYTTSGFQVVATDDGAGNITDFEGSTGTINYATGAIAITLHLRRMQPLSSPSATPQVPELPGYQSQREVFLTARSFWAGIPHPSPRWTKAPSGCPIFSPSYWFRSPNSAGPSPFR